MKSKWSFLGAFLLGCAIFVFWAQYSSHTERAGKPNGAGLTNAGTPLQGASSSGTAISGKSSLGTKGGPSVGSQNSRSAGPGRSYPMADMGRRDFLKNASLLDHHDGPADAAGHFQRVSLYRTDMKYPLIRVEESLSRGANGEETVLSQQAAVADHIMVGLQAGATESNLAQLAAQNGASIVKTPVVALYLVQLPNPDINTLPRAIQTFGQFNGVLKYAEADSIVQASLAPNDPDFTEQWSLNNTGQTSGKPHADIDATDAWGVIDQSPNVLVAVIDSGIDFNHPDLQANIWTNPNPGQYGYANDLHGWNFYANNNNPQDDFFHGTHVSGTIGAVGNNGAGVTGVTWHVKLVPLKFLDSTGSGYTSDAVNAIAYATAVGARIMSNSWGGGGYSQALKNAIDAANTAGALFVAAAGNDGTDTDSNPTYPADFTSPNILSVAATDDNDQLASFSNYGTTTVQIAAPGVGILSTFPTVATAAMTSDGLPTSYGQISGTSMATPHVSGVAALALAQNPSLTVAQLRALLLARVTQLPQLAGVVQTAGRLNAYNVVNPNWQGGGAQLQLTQTTFDDSEGNGDGTANPGEIIHFTPTVLDSGGSTVNGVTAQIVSEQTTATVLGTGIITIGTLLPQQSVTATAPFRVQLAGNVAVGTTLTFDIIIQGNGLAPVHGSTSVVVQASRGFATTSVNFQCGEIKADPGRNLVYAVDLTNSRILAIDTNLGQLAAAANLDATSVAGMMAVSLDDTKLYVVLPTAQKIQVFSLPSLSPLGNLPLNFSPYSIACGVGGRLYVAGGDPTLHEISPTDGHIIQIFNGSAATFDLFSPLLRTSQDGTKLYVSEGELIGFTGAFEYDITGTTPALVNTYDFQTDSLNDFAVDDANSRLYLMNGGFYGVNVFNMITSDDTTVWPLGGSYGVGAALLPSGSVIYGASGDANSGVIVEYDRTSGTILHTYTVGTNGASIQARGIAVTPNGNVFYVRSTSGGNATFGLIGGNTLQITNPPPLAPGPDLNLSTISFSDSEGNGDGVPNSGEIIDLTPAIANVGGQAAANVGVSLSSDSNATVISSTSQTITSVAAGSASTTPTSFRVQLASPLALATVVNFTFTITPASGSPQTYNYTLVIQPLKSVNVTGTNLALGEILADQQRDLVYMIDKTDMEVLAFDTDAGHITTTAPMAGTQAVNWNGQCSGMMAESVDGSYLYVAEPQTNTIQKFSLPGLTSVATWTFSFQPVSLACDALGRLYCSTTDSTQDLVQINGATGAVLTHSGPAFATSVALIGPGAYGTTLHRNAAGTELYGNGVNVYDQTSFYRFSTTGAGAPTQLNVLQVAGWISDYVLDQTRSQFYVSQGYAPEGNGGINVIPLNLSSVSTWPAGTTNGSLSVSLLPGNSNVLSASTEDITLFSNASGSDIYDYLLPSTGPYDYGVKTRGLATTPNGRTLYVDITDTNNNPTSVDGYSYHVGLIGGTVNMQPPGPTPIGLQSIAITDPSPGSNDGFVHPGQTVQLAPVFENFLNIQITGVSVQLTTTDSLATVVAPSTSTIGSVNSFTTFSPATNFKVAISAAATDGYAIPLNFVVSYDNGAQQTIPYTLYVTAPLHAETQVNFAIGDMLSDPTRDLAYVIDNTDLQLLAINTDTGTVSKSVKLASAPGTGHLALSADGSHLYIALTAAQQIQVVSLPNLQQSDIINLNFEPYSLAAGSDGKLYASSADNAWEYLRQIDPVSGETIGTFGHQTYYQSSVLRLSGDHSTLYVAETGLSGYGSIDSYAINSSGLPTYTTGYPFLLANLFDLAIDEVYQRIYSVSGGVYGVGVTDMVKGTTSTWSDSSNYAPYGCAVCFLPTGTFIYGGSYGEIRRYNRFDGTPLADFGFSSQNAELMPRGMAMTANGRILYATSEFTGSSNVGIDGTIYRLGIIGGSSISITPATTAPAVYAGKDLTVHLSQAAALSATVTSSVTNVPVSWSEVSGPSGATINSASTGSSISFSAPGVYQIESTATQGSLTGSDIINVTVLPDPVAVSVTASATNAVPGGQNGAFTFSRTGSPVGAFAVSYTVSGSAQSGVDYTANLTGTATIPDGSSSVTIPITATTNASHGSVTATLAASANYQPGISQSATVNIVVGQLYSQWAANLSLGDRAPSATPLNDGVPNLLKYLWDISATQPMSAADYGAMPAAGFDTTSYPGTSYLVLTYRQNAGMSGITVMVQTSSDLQTWSVPQPPDISLPAGTAENGDPMMEIGVKWNGQSAQFIRMNVIQ